MDNTEYIQSIWVSSKVTCKGLYRIYLSIIGQCCDDVSVDFKLFDGSSRVLVSETRFEGDKVYWIASEMMLNFFKLEKKWQLMLPFWMQNMVEKKRKSVDFKTRSMNYKRCLGQTHFNNRLALYYL